MADTVVKMQEQAREMAAPQMAKAKADSGLLDKTEQRIDEKLFNMANLMKQVDDKRQLELDAATMAKCTTQCFMSMQESTLLPTERRCLRNCFVKSADFNKLFAHEASFQMRGLQKNVRGYTDL